MWLLACRMARRGVRIAACELPRSACLHTFYSHLQVMDNLFCCLHRAELGGEAEGCPDPQLPVRVRLPAGELSRSAMGGAPVPLAPRRSGPRSIVQMLFGIDVQARPRDSLQVNTSRYALIDGSVSKQSAQSCAAAARHEPVPLFLEESSRVLPDSL